MLMRTTFRLVTTVSALLLLTAPLAAQQAPDGSKGTSTTGGTATPAAAPVEKTDEEKAAEEAKKSWIEGRPMTIQYLRAADRRGLNVFETTKDPGVEFKGFKLDFGAAFTSQVQNLSHRNTAAPNVVNGVNANQLADIGFGFNNSTANAVLHAQLAPGIRVQLTSYLSARHHNETWVKDGYIQIDQSPINWAPAKMLFEIVTVKVGHMEINYGDSHFRRSDNGNAIYNPFVGNYILDSFTTEIGGEVYLKLKNVIAMGSVTAGELRGTVTAPGQRGPSVIGKLGFDRQMNPALRLRLTGSMYKTDKNMSNTLYSGDRAGSRYYWVLENTTATESANFTSGAINPGFRNQITAYQLNPFVKFHGLEVFAVLEQAQGKAATEAAERTFRQHAVDVVYRFYQNEQLFVGARYNKAGGDLVGITHKAGAKRVQLAAGWFITPALLAKAEYVNQTYYGYPLSNIKNGGKFNGMMLEGVVGF
jgi:hypothetical protein